MVVMGGPALEALTPLLTCPQPAELQQQAGPADSGADPGAPGQPAPQPDQHQAELYALPAGLPALRRPLEPGGDGAGGAPLGAVCSQTADGSPFLPPLVFSQTPILQALQHVQASCDEAHKMK